MHAGMDWTKSFHGSSIRQNLLSFPYHEEWAGRTKIIAVAKKEKISAPV
jgi:hypothetical protein